MEKHFKSPSPHHVHSTRRDSCFHGGKYFDDSIIHECFSIPHWWIQPQKRTHSTHLLRQSIVRQSNVIITYHIIQRYSNSEGGYQWWSRNARRYDFSNGNLSKNLHFHTAIKVRPMMAVIMDSMLVMGKTRNNNSSLLSGVDRIL